MGSDVTDETGSRGGDRSDLVRGDRQVRDSHQQTVQLDKSYDLYDGVHRIVLH